MVEYVLLIVFSITIALIVYFLLKTYVPKDKYACPEGVSLLIKDYEYDYNTQELKFNITNDGRFNVTGYFIYIADEEHYSVNVFRDNTDSPRPSLEDYMVEGIKLGLGRGSVGIESTFKPGDTELETYKFSEVSGRVYSITIIPMRMQKEGGKIRIVSCSEQKTIKEIV